MNLGASQESQTSTGTATEPNDTLKILIMAVSKLAEASGNSEVVNLLHSSSASEQTVVQSDVSKTESVIPKQEVLNEQSIAQPVSEVTEPVTSNNFEVEEDFVEETSVTTKDDFAPEQISDIALQVEKSDAGDTVITKVPANIEEDASDAIGELLGSLF